jgi:hypothetical protein
MYIYVYPGDVQEILSSVDNFVQTQLVFWQFLAYNFFKMTKIPYFKLTCGCLKHCVKILLKLHIYNILFKYFLNAKLLSKT